jgi:hypothetical protein
LEGHADMSIGAFVSKERQPTIEGIFTAIGSKRLLWENLTRFIADNYGIKVDFMFYGKNYGWALRFRRGSKTLLSMYPGTESFVVQIVLGQIEAEKAFDLDLGKNVRRHLENTHQFHEGRWLFIKKESEQDLNDVKKLLLVKSRPVKKEK